MTSFAYLTDVEGQWHKLESFVARNPCVHWGPDGELRVERGTVFVFGGDAVDRGPAARRILRTLTEAKRRQPDQVVLLAGNRDLNKLRLARELRGHPPRRTPEELRLGSRGRLLRWILAHTMNAPEAFEHRALELQREGAACDDEAVALSFLEDLEEGGAMREFLARSSLAHLQEGTLFVHGGITEENLGRVPGELGTEPDLARWCSRLDAFLHAQLEAFAGTLPSSLAASLTPSPILESSRSDSEGLPPYAPLLAYQAPVPGTRANPWSVIYARPTDLDGNPVLPPAEVVLELRRRGVKRLVVGHTPTGDCPALLRDEGFELLLADNSYGRVETGSSVLLTEEAIVVEGRTRLDDGREEDVRYVVPREGYAGPIGQLRSSDGRLVKGRLRGGDYLLFRCYPGFRVEQTSIPPSTLEGVPMSPPRATSPSVLGTTAPPAPPAPGDGSPAR